MQAAARAPAAPWREVLQRALKANEACRHSRYVQLATVRPDGRPANRTIVYRGQLEGDSDVLTFVTDSRSRKIEEIAHSPWGEVRARLAGSRPLACRQGEAREGIGSWLPAGACIRALACCSPGPNPPVAVLVVSQYANDAGQQECWATALQARGAGPAP